MTVMKTKDFLGFDFFSFFWGGGGGGLAIRLSLDRILVIFEFSKIVRLGKAVNILRIQTWTFS